MGTSGMSETRLHRLHDAMAGHIERGLLPGIVTLVSRHGETHVDVIGTMDVDGSRPMSRDTIFRIASMTKPIIAAATLILIEECRLRLDDPVAEHLPELADPQVLQSVNAPVDDTVPAIRPITTRDLLTFRSGHGMLFGPPDQYPIVAALTERGLGFGPPAPAKSLPPDEWLRRLGELPLIAQPGEKWLYNTGSDILGVLIARVTGQPLEAFLRDRLFTPLGMHDTSFSVPAAKLDRLPTSYMGEEGLPVWDPATGGQWTAPPPFPSGAGGLVSTADDYHAFATMLLNNGRHGTERILSRPAVQTMTTDQLSPATKAISGFFPGYFDHQGWGMGVAVITGRDNLSATPGRYGWDGGLGTSWWSDPAEDLTGIMLHQRAEFHPVSKPYLDFWTSVYQAIDD